MERIGRHRLTEDFADHEGVRYFGSEGVLLNTSGDYEPIADVNRFLHVGDTW